MLLETAKKYSWGKIAAKMPVNPAKTVSGQDITGHGYFNLSRDPWDKASGTLCQMHGGLGVCGTIHPAECRKYTINELKRLTSIPDDFILTGDYSQQYERLARMVQPVMMKHIAETIQKEVLDKCRIT